MFDRPLWHAGFRPFFLLAFASGALLPVIWALVFAGAIALPATGVPALAWHAHEMFYGFGWAVLGGFLLTATKNWVKIRGIHGAALALAAALWLLERAAVFLPPDPLRLVLLNLFPVYVVGYVVTTLVRYRRHDTFFPDNLFFIVALPLFLVAKNLLISPAGWTVGVAMTVGLFRLPFAVMFERTMTQFMRNAMGVDLPRTPWLDRAIKVLLLVAIFEALLPTTIAGIVLALAALLLFARLLTWKPLVGLRRFEIAIMYVGYFGLVLHLVLAALRTTGLFTGVGTLSLHTFTLLTMGVVIPGMLIRISQGHTGRKLLFTRSDRFAIGAMGVAAFFRLVATQLWPARYTDWVSLAALGWSACFVLVGIRLAPFLWKARVDGKLH
ncbi:NnrS family protein [Vulgatibacter sp.]|uniref:NnrS family protein n=1 Tax=Vulgatibacter sp. TaxID=1971226 RepID=UPI00356132C2